MFTTIGGGWMEANYNHLQVNMAILIFCGNSFPVAARNRMALTGELTSGTRIFRPVSARHVHVRERHTVLITTRVVFPFTWSIRPRGGFISRDAGRFESSPKTVMPRAVS
jgi:hypothetical protein